MVPLSKKECAQLPPPGRGCRRPKFRFEFTYDAKAAEGDAAYDGYSALVTTAPREQSAELVFTKYKQQGYSELVNHQFKTPLAVHPVFLKSPPRVESLVFLMMMALTAYFLLQRIYRQNVPAKATVQEHRTTTETLLRAFSNYTLLIHHNPPGPRSAHHATDHSATPDPPATGLRHSRSNPQPPPPSRPVVPADAVPLCNAQGVAENGSSGTVNQLARRSAIMNP
jgi:hypothetical protein